MANRFSVNTLILGGKEITTDGNSINVNGETPIVSGENFRIKDGYIQFLDVIASGTDPTKPWRAIGVSDGSVVCSEPMDN